MRKLLLIALATLSLNCDLVVDSPSGNSNDDSNSSSGNSSNNNDDDTTGNEGDENGDGEENSSGGGDCESCTEEALNGACKKAADACDANQACGALLQCLSDCGDNDTCVKGCMEDNKDGQDDYFKTMDCLFCGECTDACEVPADSCEGSGGGSGGGGDSGGDACDSCIGAALEDECADAKAACDANPDCGKLGNCYNQCGEGDSSCLGECDSQHGAGKEDFMAVGGCLFCEACTEECDSASSCGG